MVTIDLDGIEDRRFGVGKIPWTDIVRVYEGRVKSERFLCIEVADESRYLGRMTLLKRLMARGNRAMGCSILSISFGALDRSFDSALEEAEKFLRLLQNQSE